MNEELREAAEVRARTECLIDTPGRHRHDAAGHRGRHATCHYRTAPDRGWSGGCSRQLNDSAAIEGLLAGFNTLDSHGDRIDAKRRRCSTATTPARTSVDW